MGGPDGLGCLQQAQIVFPAQYPLHGPVQQLLGDDIVLQCLEDLGNLFRKSVVTSISLPASRARTAAEPSAAY